MYEREYKNTVNHKKHSNEIVLLYCTGHMHIHIRLFNIVQVCFINVCLLTWNAKERKEKIQVVQSTIKPIYKAQGNYTTIKKYHKQRTHVMNQMRRGNPNPAQFAILIACKIVRNSPISD